MNDIRTTTNKKQTMRKTVSLIFTVLLLLGISFGLPALLPLWFALGMIIFLLVIIILLLTVTITDRHDE